MQEPAYALYNGLSEDCLTLNVIRPRGVSKGSDRLPVMFWIHGGGNANGQSIYYNGTALVQYSVSIQQPVIYVGINYRLAGFGFLNSPEFQAAGVSNLGLKDQYLALQWVRDNIASFGGNPDKVIIFGESAGAFDSWAQLHRAYTKGETNKYFHGMITNSGSPGSPRVPLIYAPEAGLNEYRDLLSKANCSTASSGISCLRNVPVDKLSPLLVDYSADFTLDHDWFNKNATELLTSNQVASIPIIHGANLDEGAVFLAQIFPDSALPAKEDIIKYIAPDVKGSVELAKSIADAYYNKGVPLEELGKNFNGDVSAPDSYWPAVAVYGDSMFQLGRRALLRNACARGTPVWGYHLDQTPPLSLANRSYEYPGYNQSYARRIGVFHGTDLGYYFGEISNLKGATKGDVAVSTTIMSAFISFAYHLNPNGPGVPHWPQYCEGAQLSHDKNKYVGMSMFFTQQGSQKIEARSDTVRQVVYETWNKARQALGLEAIY